MWNAGEAIHSPFELAVDESLGSRHKTSAPQDPLFISQLIPVANSPPR